MHTINSIAFPLISAGIFRGNLKNAEEVSSKELLKAYNKFIKDYPDYNIKVILCIYSLNEYNKVKELFKH